jgi:signal transduction histidine kinase
VSPLRSLRSRLLLGSVLWSMGLLALSHMASMHLMVRFDQVRRIQHGPVVVLSIIFMAAGFLQLRRGLSPFERLRPRLAAVRDGREDRVEGSYPSEVQPLVDDLNGLLDHRAGLVRRALARAGDLAHGLKTPLAVIAQEAERAAAAGHPELASTIDEQVDRMRRQLDYHLAHARAAASGSTLGARCSLAEAVEGLARALLRLHAERGVAIAIDVPADHFVRATREDVEEMLGNLLDNACKWARGRVAIASSAGEERVSVFVDDDGPGLDPSLRDAVLQRGVRADEAAPGTGLGLAIVRDLAELYGGAIRLEASPTGGVRACLDLPS